MHIGCGGASKVHTTPYFNTDEWEEVRLDMDESVKPDILLSMTELHTLPLRSYDAIYCAHALEHVNSHEVPYVIAQFIRLLKRTGHAVITVPDLQTVCQYVVNGNLLDPMYHSPAGPIAPIDTLYGHRLSLANGQMGMAHRTGFIASSMGEAFRKGGFQEIAVHRNLSAIEINAVVAAQKMDKEEFHDLVKSHFPVLKDQTSIVEKA